MLLKERDLIKNFLSKAPVLELGQIWQTVSVDRVIYKISSLEILDDGLIFSTTQPFQFNEEHPVYINVNYKSTIFKLEKGDYRFTKNQFICKFPQEAKAIESRKHPRTHIPKRANITLTLRTLSSETALDAKIILHNVSEQGVGGSINNINVDFFERFKVFQVIKICDRVVKEDNTMTTKHMRPEKKTGRYIIGFELNKAFTNKFHEILLLKMKENLEMK